MKISVFGMGYVGVVTAACLCRDGHTVIGVDVLPAKVQMINGGLSPIIEEEIGELIQDAVASGRLRATASAGEAVAETDLAIVCVGTPSRADGALDLQYILQVMAEIGTAMRQRPGMFIVVVRSTLIPGAMRKHVIPKLEESSGRKLGHGYDVLFHPEFLREGNSVSDYYNPPKIVVGETNAGHGIDMLLSLYPEKIEAPRIVCSIEVAEMVKYSDNLYHALKITFANEIGQFCHAHGINGQEVMSIFCHDQKLNISSRYLKPGFMFGGSCLPKDLRAFLAVAKEHHLTLPMLEGVLPSNQRQLERVLHMILAFEARRIGFHGIAFKVGTDDLRESPLVELAERLLGKGKKLVIFDQKVQVSRLLGGNKSYVQQKFPHLSELLTNNESDLLGCDLILLGHPASPELVAAWSSAGRAVLDLNGELSASDLPGISCIL